MIIYLGLDESNHGRDPEVIAAVFSNNFEDIVPKKQLGRAKKMTRKELNEYFNSKGRSMRIVAIPRDYLPSKKSPLVQALPHVLAPFMGNGDIKVEFDVYLDGGLGDMTQATGLIERINGASIVGMHCFPKQPRSSGPYNYPQILAAADSLAYQAYEKLFKGRSLREIVIREGLKD